jgi:hypothetical protein
LKNNIIFLVLLFSLSGLLLPPLSVDAQSPPLMPSWFKTNAQWWNQGLITDTDMVNALESLIIQDVIPLDRFVKANSGMEHSAGVPKGGTISIPSYQKEVFGFWADGVLTDKDIENSIGYLMSEGIINSDKIQTEISERKKIIIDSGIGLDTTGREIIQPEKVEIDPELATQVFISQKWNGAIMSSLISILDPYQEILDNQYKEATATYAENKNEKNMNKMVSVSEKKSKLEKTLVKAKENKIHAEELAEEAKKAAEKDEVKERFNHRADVLQRNIDLYIDNIETESDLEEALEIVTEMEGESEHAAAQALYLALEGWFQPHPAGWLKSTETVEIFDELSKEEQDEILEPLLDILGGAVGVNPDDLRRSGENYDPDSITANENVSQTEITVGVDIFSFWLHIAGVDRNPDTGIRPYPGSDLPEITDEEEEMLINSLREYLDSFDTIEDTREFLDEDFPISPYSRYVDVHDDDSHLTEEEWENLDPNEESESEQVEDESTSNSLNDLPGLEEDEESESEQVEDETPSTSNSLNDLPGLEEDEESETSSNEITRVTNADGTVTKTYPDNTSVWLIHSGATAIITYPDGSTEKSSVGFTMTGKIQVKIGTSAWNFATHAEAYAAVEGIVDEYLSGSTTVSGPYDPHDIYLLAVLTADYGRQYPAYQFDIVQYSSTCNGERHYLPNGALYSATTLSLGSYSPVGNCGYGTVSNYPIQAIYVSGDVLNKYLNHVGLDSFPPLPEDTTGSSSGSSDPEPPSDSGLN